ncbi:MAG: polyprenyl synthetase family protein [Candidatus Nanopelagicales bacterium]|nr:polyprenyl synthetase family protein [Candidatus Nanopelagicales bacterium]
MPAESATTNELSPFDAADLRDRVQKAIDQVLAQESSRLTAIDDDLLPLVEALTALLAGGKRLRPAFCYWGWRGALAGARPPAEIDGPAMRAAAALEFLQACALIHDDVMDGSDTRRGQPAAHRRFANLHRNHSWMGSPEHFGIGAAILLGDMCLSWSDQVLLTSGMPDAALNQAKPVYDEMRTELMAGQYLDLLEQARGGGSIERALRVVRYKSAKYTIEKPLHLGAALAGASPEIFATYTAFGLPLGEAFQLRDDVLGVFGDPKETGKPAGDDLREGKRTVLIAIASERASSTQMSAIRTHLGDPGLDLAGVGALREIIAETGAREHAENLIDSLLETSLDAMQTDVVNPEARRILTDLAHAATKRSV